MGKLLWAMVAVGALAASTFAQRKEPVPHPPAFVQAETARLAFHISALSAPGTLAKQVRDAVDSLRKAAGTGHIVKVRAFVAASNDAAQAAELIAKSFADRHVPLPVISIIKVAGMWDPNARVALESIAEAASTQNPDGLAFISGQATQAALDPSRPKMPVAPLAEKSVISLQSALTGLNLAPADVVRVTCFTSSLEDREQVHGLVGGTFVHAAFDLIQMESAPANHVVECEATARLKERPPEPVRLVNPTQAAFAQAALVRAPSLVFTSTEPGEGSGDAAVRQAFTRIKQVLDAAGSSLDRVFYARAYPAGAAMLQKYRDVRWEFLDKAHAPASTNLPFDGVAAPGASVGIEVIALPKN